MHACEEGNLEEVLLEISRGADVNTCNKNGTTALMYAKTAAIGSADLRIIKALLQAGAQIDATDNKGRNALDYASENSAKIIEFLKENQK